MVTGQWVALRCGLLLGEAAVDAPRVAVLASLLLLRLGYEPLPCVVVSALRGGPSLRVVLLLLRRPVSRAPVADAGDSTAVEAELGWGHGVSTGWGRYWRYHWWMTQAVPGGLPSRLALASTSALGWCQDMHRVGADGASQVGSAPRVGQGADHVGGDVLGACEASQGRGHGVFCSLHGDRVVAPANG